MTNKKLKAGFTLVELIIVVAIIGTILTVSFISFTNARQKARDAKRLSDITQIQNTLELYLRDEGRYPDTITFGSPLTGSSSIRVYMNNLPQNPSPRNDGACPNSDYSYETAATGTVYKLGFCLSEPTGNLEAGPKCATPQGIMNRTCFLCGEQLSYAGKIYATVAIGNQCWLRENINTGTMLTWSQTPSNDAVIEKYCTGDTESNCTNDGALYTWPEAMGLPAACISTVCAGQINTPHQGLCPSGWHVPTDSEFKTLEMTLGMSQAQADTTGWRGTNEGDKLERGLDNPAGTGQQGCTTPSDGICGSSGFESILAGSGSESRGAIAIYILADEPSGTTVINRSLRSSAIYGTAGIYRTGDNKNSRTSLRCLKN